MRSSHSSPSAPIAAPQGRADVRAQSRGVLTTSNGQNGDERRKKYCTAECYVESQRKQVIDLHLKIKLVPP